MVNTSRSEHLAWCKTRALEYIGLGDIGDAWRSFLSDMTKSDETASHSGLEIGTLLVTIGHLNTAHQMREFIEGFN